MAVLKGHTSWVRSVAVTPDGKTLFSGSDDNTVRSWALPGGKCIAVLKVGRCKLTPGFRS